MWYRTARVSGLSSLSQFAFGFFQCSHLTKGRVQAPKGGADRFGGFLAALGSGGFAAFGHFAQAFGKVADGAEGRRHRLVVAAVSDEGAKADVFKGVAHMFERFGGGNEDQG